MSYETPELDPSIGDNATTKQDTVDSEKRLKGHYTERLEYQNQLLTTALTSLSSEISGYFKETGRQLEEITKLLAPDPVTPPVIIPDTALLPKDLPPVDGKIQPSSKFSVNLTGGDFGSKANPGILYRDYTYPSKHFAMYKAIGLNHFRVPFKSWRIFETDDNFTTVTVNQKLAGDFRKMLDDARDAGCCVIADMHDYLYFSRPNGVTKNPSTGLPLDFWGKIAYEFAKLYGDHPALYGFDLMNEPLNATIDQLNTIYQSMIDNWRKVDNKTFLFVEGLTYAKAWSYPTSNKLLKVTDSADKLVISFHSYPDKDGSGTWSGGTDYALHAGKFGEKDNQMVFNIKRAVEFAKTQGYKRFHVGEIGFPTSGASQDRWLVMMEATLAYMQKEGIMCHFWAVGDWYPGTYPMKIDLPTDGNPLRPQLKMLQKYNVM